MQQPYPILDGNVKRVLARYFAIKGWPGDPAISKKLWAFSESLTPKKNVHHYTQAMMDLGATLCTAKNPRCDVCPLQHSCKAHAQHLTNRIPGKRPKKTLPEQSTQMLIILQPQAHRRDHYLLLKKRPATGIWGGLWSLPECSMGEKPSLWCKQHLKLQCNTTETLNTFRHTFTHFHLDITPIICTLKHTASIIQNKDITEMSYQWHSVAHLDTLALPAPVKRLLNRIAMALNSGAYDVAHSAM
jgi:A/G-specific adenine glycosylase